MKNTFETITQFIFLALLFVLVQFIVLGVTLDFSRLSTWAFWVEVLGQFALTMTTFNVIYYLHKRKKAHDEKGRFYCAWRTNKLRVKRIEENKMYDELDEAVNKENKERLKDKCNTKIYKLCSRLSYDEVNTEKPIAELFQEYRVLSDPKGIFAKLSEKRRAKKLTRLIEKIRAGKIRIRKIKAKVFLTDKELAEGKFDSYDINNTLIEFRRNTDKAITFFLCSIFLAVIGFSFISPNWWVGLIKNVTFVLSGVVSGVSSAMKTIKTKTAIYENRNRFFSKHLNLMEEYSPVEEQKK